MSAGGCRNFPDSFHSNPQFRVTLEDPDDDDEVDNCTIVIGMSFFIRITSLIFWGKFLGKSAKIRFPDSAFYWK